MLPSELHFTFARYWIEFEPLWTFLKIRILTYFLPFYIHGQLYLWIDLSLTGGVSGGSSQRHWNGLCISISCCGLTLDHHGIGSPHWIHAAVIFFWQTVFSHFCQVLPDLIFRDFNSHLHSFEVVWGYFSLFICCAKNKFTYKCLCCIFWVT